MSKATAAYLAGFIDGEGYISLHPSTYKGEQYYQPVLKVTSTDQWIVEWMQASFGGSVHYREYDNPRFRDAATWQLNGKKLKPFLQAVAPYLRLKKEQAEILLEKYRLQERHPGTPYTQSEKTSIVKMYRTLRDLNKRGT